ncbi:AEC family transporter [Pseudomonas sp. MDMC216]|nr:MULTISPECIES: AEC family transporter [unclassified Pseudomonas]MBA4681549.1 AEC family transporter [Pseudomonas sp.]MDI5992547.1 AEC family transporter [Pseudomonas sp. MDMC216]MDI6005503.1 AEC family transporter [Pseudomonas sp. MDMC17]RAR33318.1 AEC family transporter [Pseudomonas sp. MDMC224]
MLAVLSITAPIFILIGLGFLSARIALVNRDQVRGMGTFVIYFALPSLVFKALAERSLSEVLNGPYLAAYAMASLSLFGIGLLLARRWRGLDLSSSAILAMGMAVPNSGFVGYPIAVMVIGPTAALAMALGMLVENLLMIPLALAIAEAGRQDGQGWTVVRETALRLLRNPLIIAIVLGLGMSLLELRLPVVPARVIEMLAAASAPVALFVIGATLNGMKAGGMAADLAQTSIGKLILHPLLMFAALSLVPGVDPMLMVASVLFASAPMLSVFPILGQRFGLEERCAAALVGCTVLAFFSISGLLALLRWQGLLPG